MNKHTIEQTIDELKNLFSKDLLLKLALSSRFIQRSTTKLCPTAFLIVMVVELSLLGTHSLRTICDLMVSYGGSRISPQALSQKLNQVECIRFFRKIYSKLLCAKFLEISSEIQQEGILKRFKNVYLEDSTSCTLHEKVAGSFKGVGGSASKAGYKIHMIWNATKNNIKNLMLSPSSVSDLSQAFNIVERLQTNDLVLRDLGYFNLSCFKAIEEKKAYYVSRLKFTVKVYTLEGKLIEDLGKYLEERLKKGLAKDFEAYLGLDRKLKVRIVCWKVPQKVYDERIRKQRRKAQKNRSTLSKKIKNLQKYTFLITNIPDDLLSNVDIAKLYKFRWQIELLFKAFKSKLNIEMIKGKSKTRVECFILSKLIALFVTTGLFSYLALYMKSQFQRELSFWKFLDWIISQKYMIILFKAKQLEYDLMQLKNVDMLSLSKQKRSRKTSLELLETVVTFFDIYPQDIENKPIESLA